MAVNESLVKTKEDPTEKDEPVVVKYIIFS